MSSPKWTTEQLEAIEARNCNLLVSAAAGTGKTAVLVERIIKRVIDVDDPVDIDRILVVTFTKAAANEMRERISRALTMALSMNSECAHLNRQLLLLNRSFITTLHSFCLEVLHQYFYIIDLDPNFRVADDTEAALIRSDTLEELFEDNYNDENELFLELVDSYGGDRDDTGLQEIVLKLFEFSCSTPWPDDWLMNLAGKYTCQEGLPLEEMPWAKSLMEWIQIQIGECKDRVNKALELALAPGGPAVYRENLLDDISLLNDLSEAAAGSWRKLYEAINSAEFSKLNTCRNKDVDDSLKKRTQKLRDEVKRCINSIKGEYFSRTPAELIEDLTKIAPLAAEIVRLVLDFKHRYRKRKSAKGLVDFSDLEHFCLKILLDETSVPGCPRPSDIALELRQYFSEVLVDEYQDVNEVQETILSLVARYDSPCPNLFMVGDVKQSIYRFRLAEPSLFMEKYRNYPRTRGQSERGIDLTYNFRSRAQVVDAVNFIFRQLMSERVGELAYDSKAQLVCGSIYPTENSGCTAEGPVELYILDKEPVADEDIDGDSLEADESEDLDAIQREARFIGRRIREMVYGTGEKPGQEFLVFDSRSGTGSPYRPVKYRDIVVLLRTTREAANIFVEEFRRLDIPAYADLGTGYFEATEVETMLSLLKIIDNPRQDIPLAAVLRSPIVGINSQQLANIRLRDTGGEFYDAVVKSAQAEETEEDVKLRDFLNRLEQWRSAARQGPLSELIWKVYNESGYYAYVVGMPGGTQRQANLRALYDRARQYEETDFRGLFRFLRFIERFRETGNDLGTARALSENEDVVRVLSIHKSKGLEFPVVILAGLGKQFNTADLKKKYVIHKKLGLGLPVVDPEMNYTYPSILQKAIAKSLHMEMLAEEMRVLYVALTRAREKLILVGSVRDIERASQKWCDNSSSGKVLLPDSCLISAKSFMDWICPALARHPDGMPLLAQALQDETSVQVINDESKWKISFAGSKENCLISGDTPESNRTILELVRNIQPIETDGEFSAQIDKYLNWEYPFNNLVSKPSKITVTELKRLFSDDLDDGNLILPSVINQLNNKLFRRPAFLQKTTGLTPAELGTVFHLVMQHLDLKKDHSREDIILRLEDMVCRELLTLEQAKAIDVSQISAFFKSAIGKRVLCSPKVMRELPFTLAVPVHLVYNDVSRDMSEEVIVQGVIDCLFEEDDGFVVLDFKTDRVEGGRINDIVKRYQIQLDLYGVAVETILRKPVKEKYLYLFSVGREVEIGMSASQIKLNEEMELSES